MLLYFFLFYFIFRLYITVLDLPNIKMNPPQVYMCSPSWTLFLELWCWRRFLRFPWTARGSNQSILKEISPGCFFEGLMLKLKLQYFGHHEELTHWKRLWWREGLGAKGEEDDRGWDGWMASPTRWTWVWVNSGIWRWTGRPGVLQFMGWQRVGRDWVTELNWVKKIKDLMEVRSPPGDLPDPGIAPMSPALAGRFFTAESSA